VPPTAGVSVEELELKRQELELKRQKGDYNGKKREGNRN